jgi:dipeptidyl aminopeptidase/acylaminoacyl peptidase
MLKKLILLCFTATAVLFSAEAPAKRPITHEDVWLMKRVGTPVPSPDGKWAVFSVTNPAYDAKEQSSDLWLKSLTDDSPARQITASSPSPPGATATKPRKSTSSTSPVAKRSASPPCSSAPARPSGAPTARPCCS